MIISREPLWSNSIGGGNDLPVSLVAPLLSMCNPFKCVGTVDELDFRSL